MSTESMQKSPDWGRALVAGVIATVAITLSMLVQGNNIFLALGGMLMPSAGEGMKYVVGGLMHFMIGIVYALVYAAIFTRVQLPSLAKGAIWGVILTVVALVMMPVMSSMLGGGAGNPCNPCNPCAAAANPCSPAANPCASAANPCNPCAQNPCATAKNPCNPCAGAANPCAQASNPCAGAGNPCNPCGGSGGGAAGYVWSLIHHLVYGLVLAFVYKE
ncbi:MAG: hypothetical protein KatS3mg015_0470 [Fimbriimonadales bacterium]|nr:MAG: hypothetical protein KatS3mg015_0470 [Fimbriimonadales bacterium]